MKFGMCIGSDSNKIAVCKKLGYDYVESAFEMLADPKNDEKYDAFQAELKNNGFSCLSVNCFIPSALKITGPDVDEQALKDYIERGMKRGAALGVKKVVFGSGGARKRPEGFSYETAVRQIFSFLTDIVSPIAEKYGILLVIEPLRSGDTNMIESLREGAVIAAAVNRPNIRLLVDLYHAYYSGDTNDHIRSMTTLLRHAHIAEPEKRVYPAPGDAYPYADFISALKAAGCDTCSVEARCSDFEKEAADAIRVLRAVDIED
ncbi:MAG: sugar phosphate isomerase/epimerase [Clostridia bacterium]|nr:sugar phosphate isomerase/epimerase [Clostridia bacterium]